MADLGESSIARDRESLRQMIERWLWMWNYRKPIIAQTHGYCLSGGLDLIGACDIVFAASGTLFGHPAGRGMGIPVTLGMLPVKAGAAATKELLFTGDLVDADEARELGIVRRVLAPEQLDEDTAAFCARVAMNPLDALTAHKHVTNRWLEVMGIRLAALEGAEFDSIFHMTPAMSEFGRITREDGLRAALAWRDGPYASGPAADHDAARRRRT
jgi:enoyl-CoA hydratase